MKKNSDSEKDTMQEMSENLAKKREELKTGKQKMDKRLAEKREELKNEKQQPLEFELLKEVEQTNQTCPIHDKPLIVFRNLEPFCEDCAKEKLTLQTGKMTQEAQANYYKKTTYDWLENFSIFSDESLNKATFKTYETQDQETIENKKKTRIIANEYLNGANYNTLLFGKVGTGKSHLSMAMLKGINDNANPFKKCLFVSVDELMRRIKDSFNNKESKFTEQKMVERLTKADVLVLDDLGAETGGAGTEKGATDYTIRTLNAIINGRMDKPTIFTTNLTSKQLSNMYDPRLTSRMFRGTSGHVIKFLETPDKRTEIDYGF